MHELYFAPNCTVLLYAMVLPPIELVELVPYTNIRSLQHLR